MAKCDHKTVTYIASNRSLWEGPWRLKEDTVLHHTTREGRKKDPSYPNVPYYPTSSYLIGHERIPNAFHRKKRLNVGGLIIDTPPPRIPHELPANPEYMTEVPTSVRMMGLQMEGGGACKLPDVLGQAKYQPAPMNYNDVSGANYLRRGLN